MEDRRVEGRTMGNVYETLKFLLKEKHSMETNLRFSGKKEKCISANSDGARETRIQFNRSLQINRETNCVMAVI